MGKGLEWKFLQRRHACNQQVYEKMFSITNHQGNSHQNHNEISLHTIRIFVVQPLSPIQLHATPWAAACQPFLSVAISQSLLNNIAIESVIPISSSVIPFSSCHQSFPASGTFAMSQLFRSGGQIIGALALSSVLPVNIQD